MGIVKLNKIRAMKTCSTCLSHLFERHNSTFCVVVKNSTIINIFPGTHNIKHHVLVRKLR